MKIKDLFDRLIKKRSTDPYDRVIDDVREYAAFRAIEHIVTHEVEEYMSEYQSRFFAENKPELRMYSRVVMGAMLLALAQSLTEKRPDNTTISEDFYIWQAVQTILLCGYSRLLIKEQQERSDVV